MPALRFVHPPGLQQPRPAENPGGRGAQFVRERGEKLVLQAARSVSGVPRLALALEEGVALGIRRLAAADVAERLDRADDASVAVADTALHLFDRCFDPVRSRQHVIADATPVAAAD